MTKIPRLLGIDGRKMSKSYNNSIELGDSGELVREKVRRMFTDPKRIKRSDPGHPDVCNVYNYYNVFADGQLCKTRQKQCREAEVGCTDCKKELGEILTAYLVPIQKKRRELFKDKKRILKILAKGKEKTLAIAQATMNEVRQTIGL